MTIRPFLWLLGLAACTATQKTPKVPSLYTPAPAVQVVRLLDLQAGQSVLYLSFDSLPYLELLLQQPVQVQLAAAENEVDRLSELPQAQAQPLQWTVLSAGGLRSEAFYDRILVDHSHAAADPEAQSSLLGQLLPRLQPNGRLVYLSRKSSQPRDLLKVQTQLQENLGLRKSSIDTTVSAQHQALILQN